MPESAIGPDEQLTVSHQFQQAQRDTAEWLRLAASTLARLTAEAAIVTPPAAPRSALRHVEVVPITERRALLVAVLEGGAVRQQLVDLPRPALPQDLRALSSRLVARLAGADARRIRAYARTHAGTAAEIARSLAHLVEEHEAANVHGFHYEGIQNILAQPEFDERDRVREMLALLEDRTRFAELLPSQLADGEVHVTIGHEHRHQPLRHCGVVITRYGGSGVAGYVGVVGPIRMDYARSIGAVRYVGTLMSGLVRVVEGN
jgi:heat-inducible transcriptional repressor